MPDARIIAALDVQRFHELTKRADLGENLWTALRLAAERGDADIVRHHVKQIIVLLRDVNDLTKRLGQAEADDARQ
jgi:hypothetical protein